MDLQVAMENQRLKQAKKAADQIAESNRKSQFQAAHLRQ